MKFSIFNFQFSKRQEGFTLIEVLVSVFAFSIIVMVASGIFSQLLALQRRGSAAQKVQEDVQYLLERMSREIRVSTITNQNDGNCDRTTLSMVHPVHGTVTYSLSSGQVRRQVNAGAAVAVSSSDVTYNKLRFCVWGTAVVGGVGDLQPARVGIVFEVASEGTNPTDTVTFNIQTTVISREILLELTTN